MAWSRKSKPKGERVVRRTRADGTPVEYRYPAYKPRKREYGDTIDGLIDAYLSSPEWLAFSQQTKAGRTSYLKPMAKLGAYRVAEVTRRDIIAIYDIMRTVRGDGAAGGFLAASRALFAWAVEKEWIAHSPVMKIKKAPGGHWRAWTRQEADAAEHGLPEHLRRAVVMARHTGQRRGDLCALTWGQYDGATITLTQQKTKPGAKPVALIVPVTPALKAELDAWKAAIDPVPLHMASRHILTNFWGKPWKPPSLSHVLPIALVGIGMSGELGIHGLRKLAATELANAGCSPHEIASITGHRTLQMVELYTKSADQVRLSNAAMDRLAAFNEKKS